MLPSQDIIRLFKDNVLQTPSWSQSQIFFSHFGTLSSELFTATRSIWNLSDKHSTSAFQCGRTSI